MGPAAIGDGVRAAGIDDGDVLLDFEEVGACQRGGNGHHSITTSRRQWPAVRPSRRELIVPAGAGRRPTAQRESALVSLSRWGLVASLEGQVRFMNSRSSARSTRFHQSREQCHKVAPTTKAVSEGYVRLKSSRVPWLQRPALQASQLHDSELQGPEVQGHQHQRRELQGPELQGAELRGLELQRPEFQALELQRQEVQYLEVQSSKAQRSKVQSSKVQSSEVQSFTSHVQSSKVQSSKVECCKVEGSKVGSFNVKSPSQSYNVQSSKV